MNDTQSERLLNYRHQGYWDNWLNREKLIWLPQWFTCLKPNQTNLQPFFIRFFEEFKPYARVSFLVFFIQKTLQRPSCYSFCQKSLLTSHFQIRLESFQRFIKILIFGLYKGEGLSSFDLVFENEVAWKVKQFYRMGWDEWRHKQVFPWGRSRAKFFPCRNISKISLQKFRLCFY